MGGMAGLISVTVLGFLEVSLSLDNAVVNAKVLKDMSPFWRKMFLTIGMLIAVFAMRGYFPLVIVSATTELSTMDAAHLAFSDPAKYSEILLAAHPMIAGFGGAFLALVFLEFFLDAEKDGHWLTWLEAPLAKLGEIDGISVLLTGIALYVVKMYLPAAEGAQFFMAGLAGIATYVVVGSLEVVIKWITSLISGNPPEDATPSGSATTTVAKAGLASFLYLEVLDASFSFDGVIGAFAVTTDVVVIMLGLTIGAMFVRSLTIVAVDKDTLGQYEYLEHGAFWAIGSLATIMFLGTFMHIPEIVSGLIGGAILLVSVVASVFSKNVDDAEVGTVSAGPG